MLLPGINIFVLHAQHEVLQMITKSEQEQILKLFEDGDRAIIAADVAELSRNLCR